MDSSGMEVLCKNSTFGCTFASSSEQNMVDHFQGDCAFHPLQCFQCNEMVPKMTFAKHYEQCCKDSSASPCPPPEEAPDAAEVTASATAESLEEHFSRECVTGCAVCVKGSCSAMKDVSGDFPEVKVIKETQQDLEAIVKGQAEVIREFGKSIMMVAEKVNKVQEDVSGLVHRLEKDAVVERVENVDGLVKKCAKESKLRGQRLSRVMRDVVADVAGMKLMREEEQDLVPNVKRQGDLAKELGKTILTNADKVNKVEQGVEIIVKKQVHGLVKEVRMLTHPLADQSRIHWCVENVSQHIERAETKTGGSYVKSDVFVVRGYSLRLRFRVQKRETRLCMGLYLRLCRGPNDSGLQWPFRIPFTLSLVHPKDASKTRVHKTTPPSTDPKCFEKPKDEENTGVGTGVTTREETLTKYKAYWPRVELNLPVYLRGYEKRTPSSCLEYVMKVTKEFTPSSSRGYVKTLTTDDPVILL